MLQEDSEIIIIFSNNNNDKVDLIDVNQDIQIIVQQVFYSSAVSNLNLINNEVVFIFR